MEQEPQEGSGTSRAGGPWRGATLSMPFLPEMYDDSLLSRLCGEALYAYDTVGPTRTIAEPVRDFLSRGGKGLRSRLFGLILETFGRKEEDFRDFTWIVELSHNGTLIIDDIEDGSTHRRGKPCIHHIYGTDVAMNAGNALYFLSLLPLLHGESGLTDAKRSRLFQIYVQGMIRLHFGQGMDIAWHKGLLDLEKITEEKYLQMCSLKTGSLYRMSAEIAGVLADAPGEAVEVLGRFGCAIGVAYQIQDDLLDLQSERFALGKGGRGKDITEGKVTLMVIHALQHGSPEEKERLKEILALHTEDPGLIEEAVALLRKQGSLSYAARRAREILEESCERLSGVVPDGADVSRLLGFADSLLRRDL